ncbi:complement C1r subcomponent-like [Polypterus senegalus]|uniref:complement C1r subcomponent-like n=1 Tax=Polypterus senegalus TaxID=55291 RepID=UPI0019652ECE|nr:complement C1r subcomponent-like [Polypterus senegalus]
MPGQPGNMERLLALALGAIYLLNCFCPCLSFMVLDNTFQPASDIFGKIQSPNYPKPYPHTNYTEWNLQVPKGYRLQLVFKHFDLEPSHKCSYDYVKVMHHRKILGLFCGQETSETGMHPGKKPILSPDNTLKVVFNSDLSHEEQYLGFVAHYQALDIDECAEPTDEDEESLCSHICHNVIGSYFCSCRPGYTLQQDGRTCKLMCNGEIYSELKGVLTSPGYPKPYPPGVSCNYSIQLEKGFLVTLTFVDVFDIETYLDGGCHYDSLQILIPGNNTQTLCGKVLPKNIETGSNRVDILFQTDDSGHSKGWKIEYFSDRIVCPTPEKFLNGRITPVFEKYRYRDYIRVKCDTGYKMIENGKEITSFLSACMNDGKWHRPLPQCLIIDCGKPLPLLNGNVEFLKGNEIDNFYQSVIKYHCNEPFYKMLGTGDWTFSCSAQRKWEDEFHKFNIPDCLPVCGKPQKHIAEHQRILGGRFAPKGTFPWQVFLTLKGRGGAALISDQWIMTAAHNIFSKGSSQSRVSLTEVAQELEVRLGDTNVERLVKIPKQEVEAVFVHPNFSESDTDFNNDIALIKLSSRVTLNETIMPICLPEAGSLYEKDVVGYVSGWGITESRRLSSDLKYVALPIVDHSTCQNSVETIKKSRTEPTPDVTDNMFCAGRVEGGDDTCSGDSGGVFALISESDHEWYAAGIVSWGIDCGKKHSYGVYTKVSNYLDWIKQTMSDN